MTKHAAQAILALPNPTLLEIHMAADLTQQKIEQLRQTKGVVPELYGRLFYIANDAQSERAAGRVFGLWTHLKSFWTTYAPGEAEHGRLFPGGPLGQTIVFDSLSQMSKAMRGAAAKNIERKIKASADRRKTK